MATDLWFYKAEPEKYSRTMPMQSPSVEKLKVIHVRGTDRAMGRQHAEQVGEACGRGMPGFYHGLLARHLDRKPARWTERVALSTAKRLLDPVLVNRLLKQVPAGALDRLQGMAETAGLSHRELQIALVLPDLLPLLQATFLRAFPGRFVEAVPPRFGCSSFVARDDRFLVARNLDFPGVGYWDRYPVIQCTTPESGLRAISFTSAGVPLGGITGINEERLFVAIHQHYGKSVSLSGALPYIVGEKILTQARTLDQAMDVLQSTRLASSWAFVLADGKTRESVIWEGTPQENGLLRLQPGQRVLSHSNYFQSPSCQCTEFSNSARMNWDNHHRKSRLDFLAGSWTGGVTPQKAAKAIADHFDPYWGEEKIVNRIVSQAFNIQCLVVDPENLQAWVAQGPSPISLGGFQGYDLARILDGGEGSTAEVLEGYRFQDPSKAQAKKHFVESLVCALDGREDAALDKIGQSLSSYFTPEVGLTAGVVAMKAGQMDRAKDFLARAVDEVEKRLRVSEKKAPPEYFEMRLFQGRWNDLQGRRAEALRHYAFVVESAACEDLNLKRLASRRTAYSRSQLDRILLPYSTYAPFV